MTQTNSVRELQYIIEKKQSEFEQATKDGKTSEELSSLYKELKDLQMELALARIKESDNA